MKICMIGTGYVGLVSGVCFSDLGNDVICVDKDQNKIYKSEMYNPYEKMFIDGWFKGISEFWNHVKEKL